MMARISPDVLEAALVGSADPLAADLLGRLRRGSSAPTSTATRPYPAAEALGVYRRKAARGDRPNVRTEGYAELLGALSRASHDEVIVHGVAFADVVYLVFTDPARTRCVGVLRKTRIPSPR
jgi:hypothetical protein